MEITVVGLGYVGLVNATYLASLGNTIFAYDIDKNKISLLRQGVATLEEPNLQELLTESLPNLRFSNNHKDAFRHATHIFICVDTPQGKDGEVDLRNFYSVLDNIAEDSIQDQCVVIRSTVPVGTNRIAKEYLESKCSHHFDVISFPEFLSQGKAVENMIHPDRLILGVSNQSGIAKAKEIAQMYLIKKAPVMITSSENAELIKYASNCYLAMKLSYINNIAQLCEKVGADVEKVAKGMSLDPRIGDAFLKAGIGYGGSCFPKDTNGLYWIANDNSVPMELVRSTIHINESQVKFFLDKIFKRFKSLNGLNVAVLGVAFKGGTEDVRNSQAIPIVRAILEKNANLTIYDPLAMDNFAKVFSRHQHIKYVDYATDALKNADVVLILNDSQEFIDLKPTDFICYMRKPVIFDGRNLYKVESMDGCEYHSIGRPSLTKKTRSRKA